MDRQKLSKAIYKVGLKNRIGNAQNLYVGTQSLRAVAGPFTLRAQVQSSCLLQTINISSSNPNEFTITDMTVAGQSVMTSTQIGLGAAFDPSSYGAWNKALGISVTNNMQIVVTGTTNVASDLSLQVGLDPIPTANVKTTAEQAYSYNFCHGLGSVQIPPFAAGIPGVATLTSISNRQVVLGQLVMGVTAPAPPVPLTDIYLTSLRIDSLEMFNGQTQAQEYCITQFLPNSATIRDNTLGYSLNPQSRIDIVFANYNAAPITVSGVAFCESWKP